MSFQYTILTVATWPSSEEPDHLPDGVDVDALGSSLPRQARHGHDVAGVRDHESRSRRELRVADEHPETPWTPQLPGVVGERVLRLRHADGQVSVALLLIPSELGSG